MFKRRRKPELHDVGEVVDLKQQRLARRLLKRIQKKGHA